MGMNAGMFTCFQTVEMRILDRPLLILDRHKCYVDGSVKGEAHSLSGLKSQVMLCKKGGYSLFFLAILALALLTSERLQSQYFDNSPETRRLRCKYQFWIFLFVYLFVCFQQRFIKPFFFLFFPHKFLIVWKWHNYDRRLFYQKKNPTNSNIDPLEGYSRTLVLSGIPSANL